MIRLGEVVEVDPRGESPELGGLPGVKISASGERTRWALVMVPRFGAEARLWPGMPAKGEVVVWGVLDGDESRPVALGSLATEAPVSDSKREDLLWSGAADGEIAVGGTLTADADTRVILEGAAHTFRLPA